jgi:hypothetical protein
MLFSPQFIFPPAPQIFALVASECTDTTHWHSSKRRPAYKVVQLPYTVLKMQTCWWEASDKDHGVPSSNDVVPTKNAARGFLTKPVATPTIKPSKWSVQWRVQRGMQELLKSGSSCSCKIVQFCTSQWLLCCLHREAIVQQSQTSSLSK